MKKNNKYFAISFGTMAVLFLFSIASPMSALASVSPIDLGTAGNFVVLAKKGISADTGTSIIGDIGASPVAATGITGFGLIMDSSGTFSNSSVVTGKIYAADYAEPTQTMLTTAIGDMETAYTSAAGFQTTSASTTNVGGGVLTNLTLTPGVYTWGSAVTIPTDLTLDAGGDTNAVWIFQITGTLDLSSAKQIILKGGAQAKNIFWQVADVTTINTTAVFNGNILDQTAIVLNTGAVLNGRALAQAAVTLQSNTITAPASIPAVVLSSIAIKTPATKLSYTVGDALDVSGLTVTETFSDNSTSTIAVLASNVGGFVNSTPVVGQVLTITIGTKTTTYTVDIVASPVTLTSIAIKTPATKLSYTVGDTLDVSGLTVTETFSDNSTSTIAVLASNVGGFVNSTPVVGQVLTITIGTKTTTYTVDIVASDGTITGTVSGGLVPGALAVTSITPVSVSASADGTYANGWKYIFNITVPNAEPHLSMKFGNWISASSGSMILAANNMRISSTQADNNGATIILTGTNVFSSPSLNIVGDLNSTSLGKQVQVLIETSIPLNSVNGVYSTNFGVQTLP